jgi:hypothetical protein
MPSSHRKVIDAVLNCRSGSFGVHLYRCEDCNQVHTANSSCGNRHCPSCQADKSDQWLQKQTAKLLPCNYFLVTFTVPEELRRLVRSNQCVCYDALFYAASAALKRLAADKRFIGCDSAGFTGALHTWARDLNYHPHVHFIVPGGGVDKENSKWLSSKPDFFIHVKPLSRMYRRLFKKALQDAGLLDKVPSSVWSKEWIVNSQAVGKGESTLKYLANYVFRVAISNNRIISFDEKTVKFRYRKTGSKRWRVMELDAMEFMRRFLQHVLPHGFMKIRHYGFLSSTSKMVIQKIREMICCLYSIVKERVTKPKSRRKPVICKQCGSPMKWLQFIPGWAPLSSG